MHNILRQRLRHQYLGSSGFTLPELLVAALISLGVTTLGGFGLISILRSSQVANAQNERKVELNRSLDFIAAEIRQADEIVQNAVNEPKPPEFNTSLPSGAQPVLMLELPSLTGEETPIIYYVASPPNNTWLGPKVIYRWGPKYHDDGTYLDPSESTNWSHEPLIDSIQDTSTTPNCPDSTWTANGNLGFGSCVDKTGNIAKLYQAGVYDKPIQGSELYTAETTVATRASQLFTIEDGTVIFNEPATMNIRVLGSAISCTTSGGVIQTEAAYNLIVGQQSSQFDLSTNPGNGQSNIPVAEKTRLTVDGESNGIDCPINLSANSETDNLSQVLTLKTGDSIPNYDPFGNQLPIEDFLKGYIDRNQRITIAPNEVIFLFELYHTDPNTYGFDMQDLVVLATVTPTTSN